ncbi:large conductance mechanosensitive channel protein MscL [Candidatus Saccharibacteria bacterium]|nr:large conductance mechanosensitive channel protein MscL [Candidatus Saccharibacteria bacterium]
MAEAKKVEKEEKKTFKEEFIEFINRGSVVDLAVGVVIGGAFTAIVNSLVNDIIMPIVGLIAGGVDFSGLAIRIPNFFGTSDEAVIAYGNFIQNIIQFLIIAFAIFMVIKGMNKLNARREAKKAAKK